MLLAGLVLALGPGGESACLASDDAGIQLVQSPSAIEAGFIPASNANWKTTGPEKGSWYGYSVASAGNVDGYFGDDILVGAPRDETLDGGGAAYLYLNTGWELSTTDAWSMTAGEKGAYFGWSLAGAGDVNDDGVDDVIIGAPSYKDVLLIGDKYQEVPVGAAFVYQGITGVGLSMEPTWMYTGTVKASELGWSVAGAGDVNGDGIADIVVGAFAYTDPDNPQLNEGAVYVFFGHGDSDPSTDPGPSTDPDWLIKSNQAGAWLGAAVSAAGDVDGDGFDDLLVGAPRYVNPATGVREGAVFLFLGRGTGEAAPTSVAQAAWRAYGGQADCDFGSSVAGAGHVNADGYPAVVVSAPGYNRPSDDGEAGAVFAYCGNGLDTVLDSDPCWKAYGAQLGGGFGASVGGAGDVDGDGFDDVIVGAPTYQPDPVTGLEGAVFLYFGSPAGLSPWAGWKAGGDRAKTEFGTAVGSAGDINNNGLNGILIGAPQYFVSEEPFGAAFSFYGPLYPEPPEDTYLPLILNKSN